MYVCAAVSHHFYTLHSRKSIQKPQYQTVEWAIKARRCYLVLQEEEEVEYITLPLRISQAIYTGEESDATSTHCQQLTTQPTQDTLPATVEAQ